MSDRVAIIGGNTVGRDHFPFAVADQSGVDPNYPLSLDIDHALKWFYRVKKWRFLFEFSYKYFYEDPEDPGVRIIDGGTASIRFDFQPYVFRSDESWSIPARESDLVLNKYPINPLAFTLGYDGTLTTSGTTSPDAFAYADNLVGFAANGSNLGEDIVGGELSFCIGKNQSSTFGDLLYGAASFHPLFILKLAARDGVAYMASDDSSGFADVRTAVTMDTAYAIDLKGDPDEPTDEDHTWIYFALGESQTISPLEYWPYATKAGLPVYDTTDGSQLRDPFS